MNDVSIDDNNLKIDFIFLGYLFFYTMWIKQENKNRNPQMENEDEVREKKTYCEALHIIVGCMLYRCVFIYQQNSIIGIERIVTERNGTK